MSNDSESNANTKALINMRNDVTDMQKSIARQEVLVSKFDTALDKLSEVSVNVSKLLAVHERRIEAQEEVGKTLNDRITENHKEVLSEIKGVRADMADLGDDLKDQNKQLEADLDDRLDSVDGRVSKLERMSWIVIGGATVVGAVAAKIIGIFQFNLN